MFNLAFRRWARGLCGVGVAMALHGVCALGFDTDNPKVQGVAVVPRVTSHIETTSTNNEAGSIEISSVTNLFGVVQTVLSDGTQRFLFRNGTNAAVAQIDLHPDGSASLSGTTNRLSVSGGVLLLDGAPIASGAINATDGRVPYRVDATHFGNFAFYLVGATNAGIDGQILFGPGTTNVLYRSAGSLIYTNQAPNFQMVDSTGATVTLGVGSGIGGVTTSAGYLGLGASGGSQFGVTSTALIPLATGKNLGSATSSGQFQDLFLSRNIVWNGTTNTVFMRAGAGSPEGAVTGGIGSVYLRFDGGASTTLYVKESGAGNTGWVAYGSGGGGGASDNWTASGTTNSTLAGVGSANGGVFTNSLILLNATASKPARIGADQSVTNGVIDLASADVSGLVPKANGGTGANNSSVTFPSSGTVLTDANTANVQNKSFRTAEIFQTPFRYDGAGAVPSNTNDYTAVNLQRAVFSAAGTTNANWVEWDWMVPFDVDTAVDWKIESLAHEAGGSNTGSVTWTVGMADVASGGTSNPTSFSNWIQMTSGTLSSPSSGKLYYITGTTLTSWRSSVTAGHKIKIRMSRDGTDANSDAQTLGDWVLSYGRKTQL